MLRWVATLFMLMGLAAVVAAVAAWRGAESPVVGLTELRAADAPGHPAAGPSPSAPRFPVTVNRPAGPPRVDTGLLDDAGRPVTVACGTCHVTRAPNLALADAAALDEFHQGLTYVHGGLTCYSCHDPDDANRLRRADGRGLPYVEVQALCGQCHGPQARAYAHGAHGGMTGYWDLTRGPRERNGCTDCHDPHAPAFPQMMPTFKPRDRFLSPPRHGESEHE